MYNIVEVIFVRCENIFCIYWANNEKCVLDEIELDIQGRCNSCIYVDIDDGVIMKSREKQLKRILDLEK